MLAILFNWFAEVIVEYSMSSEEYFYAVDLLLAAANQVIIQKAELQLIGIVMLYLANLIIGDHTVMVSDFIHITDNSYTEEQFLDATRTMCRLFDFDLIRATPLDYYSQLTPLSRTDPLYQQGVVILSLMTFDPLYSQSTHETNARLALPLTARLAVTDSSQAAALRERESAAGQSPAITRISQALLELDATGQLFFGQPKPLLTELVEEIPWQPITQQLKIFAAL